MRASGPAPGGAVIVTCESREYRQEFCDIPEGVDSVTLARQRSRSPCIFNQTWGWRPNGVWVSQGCEGDFEVNTAYRQGRGPSRAGHLVCESRDYSYSFCDTGRIRDAQLVEQRSQAACVRGRTWGVERNGVWVDGGCEGEFRVVTR